MIAAALRVPDDLAELDQWVMWKFEARNGKLTKVPYNVSGGKADTTNRATWTTFESARMTYSRFSHIYTGVGFVFSELDSLAGIDLDNSLDGNGNLKPWAHRIVEQFGDTYTERSPSGRGLKIFVHGSLPANLGGSE